MALKNLGKLAEKLLQLARLETGFARADEPCDLMPALSLVVRDVQSNSTIGRRLHLIVSPGATLQAPVNLDAFAIAVTNLVQNALVHGPQYQPIFLGVDAPNVLRVSNGGPVVPPEVLQSIGQPFRRGPTAGSGSGLGLSIVRSIMEQTGGTMALHSPAQGSADGFEVVLTLATEPGNLP